MRGLLTGLFGYTAFFLVVSLLMGSVHLVVVYTLATAVALGVNGVSLARLVLKNRAAAQPRIAND